MRIQVLQVEKRTGQYKPGTPKAGQSWEMTTAQAIVHQGDGKVLAGELSIPKGHAEVTPGMYTASFRIGSMDGRIMAFIDTLSPFVEGRAAPQSDRKAA